MYARIEQGHLCQWNRGRCKSNPEHTGPGEAVHVLTASLPVAPAGTLLCRYHSPFDEPRPEPKPSPLTVVAETVYCAGHDIFDCPFHPEDR